MTFEATGDYYLWNPPTGAKNINFDLMGGQGGRSGGQGGRLTGSLTAVPTALYIYVGGAGAQGSGAAGGFNGGGTAGTGRGDEGSGGGATDLRTTTLLNDRIAVAAGGGGSGGFSGGNGGSAGGLTGSAGTSGQGQGGAGATQTAGGNGGYPNGGSWGITGDFGLGGTGGSSSTSGGGGGGGGYYGGGGGGADVDSCCSNAGGGGGGSSWAHTVQTTSVSHTSGYRAGAGVAIITYSMPPTVTTFAATSTLTKATSVTYNLVFNESVTGLTNTDILMTGSTATCTTVAVAGSGTTYTVTVSGCGVGTLKVLLVANSVTGVLAGPAVEKTAADVVIERTAPTVTVTAPSSPNSAASLQYAISFSEPIAGLAVDDFTVAGANCTIGALSGSAASYTLQVTNCEDAAQVQLAMAINSVSDLASNAGPVAAPTIGAVLIDRTAPSVTWSTAAATSFVSPAFEITFTESVSGIAVGDFLMIGAATDCVLSVQETTPGTKFAILTSGCSDGSVQVLINTGSYTDAFGNSGPTRVSASAVTTKVAQPTPTPTPTPAATSTPTPTTSSTPVPTPTQAPSSSPAPTSSAEPIAVPAPGSEPPAPPQTPIETPIQIPSQTPVQAPATTVDLEKPVVEAGKVLVAAQPARTTYLFNESIQPVAEQVIESPIDYEKYEPQITVDNPTAPKPIVSSVNWQLYGSLALGLASVSLAAVGIIRGVRQLRTRRLVRRFA